MILSQLAVWLFLVVRALGTHGQYRTKWSLAWLLSLNVRNKHHIGGFTDSPIVSDKEEGAMFFQPPDLHFVGVVVRAGAGRKRPHKNDFLPLHFIGADEGIVPFLGQQVFASCGRGKRDIPTAESMYVNFFNSAWGFLSPANRLGNSCFDDGASPSVGVREK